VPLERLYFSEVRSEIARATLERNVDTVNTGRAAREARTAAGKLCKSLAFALRPMKTTNSLDRLGPWQNLLMPTVL
jgi:hypothetical protein